MANGSQCCALEICCPPALAKKRTAEAIAKFTGAEEEYCEKFLNWMEHEDLVFAPKSFGVVMADIAAMAKKHAND